MKLVAYATADNKGFYHHKLGLLEEACCNYGISFYGQYLGEFGGAIRAMLHKPTFIHHCLRKFDGEPVLYLDADSTVCGPIAIPDDAEWDIGMIRNYTVNPKRVHSLCASAIHIKSTPMALHFLRVWAYLCDAQWLSDWCDHRRMYATLKLMKHSPVFGNIFKHLYGAVKVNEHRNNKMMDLTSGLSEEFYEMLSTCNVMHFKG